MSAVGAQTTQLGHMSGFDMATRPGTQCPRLVWVHVPGSSKSLQRQQKILNNLLWCYPRCCVTRGSRWRVLTHYVALCPVVIATDNMHTRYRQVLTSILEACAKELSTHSASSEELYRELCAGAVEEDEDDHDMRLDEEILEPAAASRVRRVEVRRRWLQNSHRQLAHETAHAVWTVLQSRTGRNVSDDFAPINDKLFGATLNTKFSLSSKLLRPDTWWHMREIDGTQWRHPITGATCRGQIMVDVGSSCVIVGVFEETLSRITSNNSTESCRDALIDGWMPDRPRPNTPCVLIQMEHTCRTPCLV